jgi:hypothetical protein
MGKQNHTVDRIQAVWNKLGGENGIERLLRGELVVTEREPQGRRPVKTKRPQKFDTFIHVDRSVHRPAYPDWVKRVMHPELESTGPADYDLAQQVRMWRHQDQQNNRSMNGQALYNDLKSNGLLESCLGLADGYAIQQKGIRLWRRVFAGGGNRFVPGRALLLRSVVAKNANLYAPYLQDDDDAVTLNWLCLDGRLSEYFPVLRFK